MSLPRILRHLPAAALALAVAACAPCPIPQTQPSPASPGLHPPAQPSWVEPADTLVVATDTLRVALVRMRTTKEGASGEFAPRVVRVRSGDLVRFVADGEAVHNVSFNWLRDDRRGVLLPADSPMLLRTGESWQTRIDLPPGTYEFACIVHVLLGMRGTLIVEP